MCIMSHPIPGTNDSASAQIILPQKQLNRHHDVYVFCCSYRWAETAWQRAAQAGFF